MVHLEEAARLDGAFGIKTSQSFAAPAIRNA